LTRARRPAEVDGDARRRQDRERLEQAVRVLLTSQGWQRWVRVRSTNGLSRYSLLNQLLIALQRPDATFVAGFRAFLSLNRYVRKGEKAMRILAPMPITRSATPVTEDEDDARTIFRAVPVFDVSQTEPIPDQDTVALDPPREPVTGDSHAHLLPPLRQLATELGYGVRQAALDTSADGWCDAEHREIVVNQRLSANGQVRVLVHELAHALGVGYREYGRRRAEVLVDTVTYVVCGSVGLDVSGDSVPYVAGWGEDGDLDAIREYAGTIDAIARRIEGALGEPARHVTEVAGSDVDPPRLPTKKMSPTVSPLQQI
jgi:antirestriction protein ArdC